MNLETLESISCHTNRTCCNQALGSKILVINQTVLIATQALGGEILIVNHPVFIVTQALDHKIITIAQTVLVATLVRDPRGRPGQKATARAEAHQSNRPKIRRVPLRIDSLTFLNGEALRVLIRAHWK